MITLLQWFDEDPARYGWCVMAVLAVLTAVVVRGILIPSKTDPRSDWTWGCVALRNEEIEELFAAIPVGTKVTILP